MKYILALLLSTIILSAEASDVYFSAGKGLREGAYAVAVGYEPLKVGNGQFGVEVELNDAGKQPEPHKNINRMLNLSLTGNVKFNDYLYGFGKFGISSTRYSHNGTNNYEADKSFKGTTASVGIETPVHKNIRVGIQVSVFEYQQANNPNMGGYANGILFIKLKI